MRKSEEIIFGRTEEEINQSFEISWEKRANPDAVKESFIKSMKADLDFLSSESYLEILRNYSESNIESLWSDCESDSQGGITKAVFFEAFRNAALNVLIQEVAYGFVIGSRIAREEFARRISHLTHDKTRRETLLKKFDVLNADYQTDKSLTNKKEGFADIFDRHSNKGTMFKFTANTIRFIEDGLRTGKVSRVGILELDDTPKTDYFFFKLPFADVMIFLGGRAEYAPENSNYNYTGDDSPQDIFLVNYDHWERSHLSRMAEEDLPEDVKKFRDKHIVEKRILIPAVEVGSGLAEIGYVPDDHGRFLIRSYNYGIRDGRNYGISRTYRQKICELRHEYQHAIQLKLNPAIQRHSSLNASETKLSFGERISYERAHLIDELSALLLDGGNDSKRFETYLSSSMKRLQDCAQSDLEFQEIKTFEDEWKRMFELLDLLYMGKQELVLIGKDERPLDLVIYNFIATARTMRQLEDRFRVGLFYIAQSLEVKK